MFCDVAHAMARPERAEWNAALIVAAPDLLAAAKAAVQTLNLFYPSLADAPPSIRAAMLALVGAIGAAEPSASTD